MINKSIILRTIVACAGHYEQNLNGNHLLFVFARKGQPYQSFVAGFSARNFLHLTGVSLTQYMPKEDFYSLCINKRLTSSIFDVPSNGITEVKLRALPALMNIHQTARMVGDFDGSAAKKLYSEKLAGTQTGCLGFVEGSTQIFYPNTALLRDIRDVSHQPMSCVLAIYRKKISEDLFCEQTYLAKGISVDAISHPAVYIPQ